MELRQLRYFVAVADEGNFTRAAARLHLSQSDPSRQIQRLEEDLGAALFERTARGVASTRAGEVLLAEARSLLRLGERARHAVRGLDMVPALLRVGLPDWPKAARFAKALTAAFSEAHPEVTLALYATPWMEHFRALWEGRHEAGFAHYPDGATFGSGLTGVRLFTNPGCYALLPAGHSIAAKPELTPDDLSGLPIWTAPRNTLPVLHDCAVQALREAGITAGFILKLSSVAGISPSSGFVGSWALITASVRLAPPVGCVERPAAVRTLQFLPDLPRGERDSGGSIVQRDCPACGTRPRGRAEAVIR